MATDLTAQTPKHCQAAPAAFVTTQWTQVLEARGDSPEAKAVLSELCAAYYAPVFAFIRRGALDEEAARDLTQEFFARLLERNTFDNVDPKYGRFRSYLLGAVKHFLSDMRANAQRLKRGGGHTPESLDTGTDTSPGLEVADHNADGPELDFDRRWALALLDRAMTALAAQQKAAGTSEQFETLKAWLTGDSGTLSQAEAGERLGMTEGSVKVAIHRLRRQFRKAIKQEIASTLRDPTQVEAEMKCLLEALI